MLLAVTAFWPVRHFEFVNYDDLEFVVENPHVASEVSTSNVLWAFAHPYTATGACEDDRVALADERQPENALAHYREALRLAPDHTLARMNLAIAPAKQGQLAEAIAQLEAVLRLEPGNQDAKKMLDAIRGPTS